MELEISGEKINPLSRSYQIIKRHCYDLKTRKRKQSKITGYFRNVLFPCLALVPGIYRACWVRLYLRTKISLNRPYHRVQSFSGQSLHEPSSKCCKVALSKLKMRMKLDNCFSRKKIFGINHHLLIFYVNV